MTEPKPKAKPEILKHGGNGGKNRGNGGILKRDVVGSILSQMAMLLDLPRNPLKEFLRFLGFFLRSLRVSGFLVLFLLYL
jgi:hypothetical protein